MILIPFTTDSKGFCLFIVLEDDTIDKIARYDPAHVSVAGLPTDFRNLPLAEVVVGYANPEDVSRIMELLKDGKNTDILKYLSRGFSFQPMTYAECKPAPKGESN